MAGNEDDFISQVKRAKTWSKVKFDDWVPAEVRKSIREFWSEKIGRTPLDWFENSVNTFEYGTRVRILLEFGKRLEVPVEGRFIHAWNNMGRVIDDNGKIHYVANFEVEKTSIPTESKNADAGIVEQLWNSFPKCKSSKGTNLSIEQGIVPDVPAPIANLPSETGSGDADQKIAELRKKIKWWQEECQTVREMADSFFTMSIEEIESRYQKHDKGKHL